MKRPEGHQSATPCIDGAVENRMEAQSHGMDAVSCIERGYSELALHHLGAACELIKRQQQLDEQAKREILDRKKAA